LNIYFFQHFTTSHSEFTYKANIVVSTVQLEFDVN